MTIWGLTHGGAGMIAQVEGVLAALGTPYEMKFARQVWPFGLLPVAWHRGALQRLEGGSDTLMPPWPEAIISSGRRAAILALEIKRLSGGKVKLIHLTDPRACRAQFDLIIAMAHDGVEGENIVSTRYALHKVTQEVLAQQRVLWQPQFAHLPRPWTGVLLGGSTHRYRLTERALAEIIHTLEMLHASQEGSLLITPSRRTGERNIKALAAHFAGKDRIFFHDLQGDNPYMGILACADRLVVSDDSVNMLSEAAYTEKPLYLLPLQGHQGTKPARFAAKLADEGIARLITTNPLENWSYHVPDERAAVVEAIRDTIDQRVKNA